MKLRVTEDKKFLQIIDSTALELEQVEYSFTKKPENWFILKKKIPHWDGDIKFIDKFNRIPIGLWQEVKKLADKYNFHLEIEDSEIFLNKDYNPQDFNDWVVDYFKESDIYPREYQLEAVRKVLKYRFCTEEISTSGGKTLIAFMIFKYLLDKGLINKMLYVVPNINLVTQTEEKFYEYEEACGKKPKWKSQCVYSGLGKKEEKVNIVFGTFQSLIKRNLDYFVDYKAVCIDECLHPDTLITMADFSQKKIKNILKGERVWTYNENKNIFEIKEIDYVYKNLSKNQQMFELEMEDGTKIKITGNHKVYTKEGAWIKVDELIGSEEILSFDMMNI